jgi:RIO-like serine/threonine protein kinase
MYNLPDDISFLSLLHNIGAITPRKSLTVEEITRWAAMDYEEVLKKLSKLTSEKYVEVHRTDGVERYYVTVDGIRKVLSIYS